MIRLACSQPVLWCMPLPDQLSPRTDVASGATVRLKGLASAMDGSKACPFGTCAQPRPGQLPLAVHITDGVADP